MVFPIPPFGARVNAGAARSEGTTRLIMTMPAGKEFKSLEYRAVRKK